VGESAEQGQHYWSTKELAEASQTKSNQLGRNPHIVQLKFGDKRTCLLVSTVPIDNFRRI